MGFSKEKLIKLLKDVKGVSRNRIQAVADYAWRHGDNHAQEIVGELDRFLKKTKEDVRLAGLCIVDLLCTYEENRREQLKKEQNEEALKALGKKKKNPFRPLYDEIDRLDRIAQEMLGCSAEHYPRIKKIFTYWTKHPWISDRSKEFLSSAISTLDSTASNASSHQIAPEPPVDSFAAETGVTSAYTRNPVESSSFPIISGYDATNSGVVQADSAEKVVQRAISAFDYDEDDEDDVLARLEKQKKELEHGKRRVSVDDSLSEGPPAKVSRFKQPKRVPGFVISKDQAHVPPQLLMCFSCTLAFRNLDRDKVSQDSLENICARYGHVEYAEVPMVENLYLTSKLSIPSVVFSSYAPASVAMKGLNGIQLFGSSSPVLISFVEPESVIQSCLQFDSSCGSFLVEKKIVDSLRLRVSAEAVMSDSHAVQTNSAQPPYPDASGRDHLSRESSLYERWASPSDPYSAPMSQHTDRPQGDYHRGYPPHLSESKFPYGSAVGRTGSQPDPGTYPHQARPVDDYARSRSSRDAYPPSGHGDYPPVSSYPPPSSSRPPYPPRDPMHLSAPRDAFPAHFRDSYPQSRPDYRDLPPHDASKGQPLVAPPYSEYREDPTRSRDSRRNSTGSREDMTHRAPPDPTPSDDSFAPAIHPDRLKRFTGSR